MAKTTILDNFLEKLPPETLLNILPHLPDLASLDSVIRASPKCYRIFDSYAVEITNAVLTCGGVPAGKYITTGYTCGHIRVLVCIIARIRSSSLPIHSLEEFDERVIREALRYCSRVRPSNAGFTPERLDPSTSPAVLRSILATSRRLTWCTLNCIDFYLSQAVSSRHVHCDAASWVAEQRVMRIFWRLQLLVDLRLAASTGKLHGWPAAEIEMLKRKTLDPKSVYNATEHWSWYELSGWNEFTPPPEFHEMLSVIAYVRQKFRQDSWWPPGAAARDVEVSREWPIPTPGKWDWKSIVYPAPRGFLGPS